MVLMCLIISCSGDKSVRVYTIKKAGQSAAMTAPSPQGPVWTIPQSWVSQPASSMHLAAFGVPFEGGEGKVTVMSLPGDGGGMLMNVNRWLKQLNLEPITEETLTSLGQPGQGKSGLFTNYYLKNDANPETAFMVTVFNLKTKTLFVKMVAPASAMDALTPSFLAFCQSIQIDE